MQKAGSKSSAGTAYDSGQNNEFASVSQHSRKPPVVCSQMSVSSFCEIKNEILSVGFNEVSDDDKETQFVIEDGFNKGGYYKVSLFKDDVSCPVFIRSHKS